MARQHSTLKEVVVRIFVAVLSLMLSACSTTVQPGHLGLYFDRFRGTLHREPVGPGLHYVGFLGRMEDFDVTYSTRSEEIRTTSSEGLQLELRIAVIYRPVRAELYELDTEIGTNFYDEVIGPEFRSAARGVFARHSYLDLMKRNEQVEDEVERDSAPAHRRQAPGNRLGDTGVLEVRRRDRDGGTREARCRAGRRATEDACWKTRRCARSLKSPTRRSRRV